MGVNYERARYLELGWYRGVIRPCFRFFYWRKYERRTIKYFKGYTN